MPFLVDSIAATIAAQGLVIDRLVHPIVPVERDADGTLTALHKRKVESSETVKRESMIFIEIARADARQARELERRLKVTLGDVSAAVTDWPKVQSALLDDAAPLKEPEKRAAFAAKVRGRCSLTLLTNALSHGLKKTPRARY